MPLCTRAAERFSRAISYSGRNSSSRLYTRIAASSPPFRARSFVDSKRFALSFSFNEKAFAKWVFARPIRPFCRNRTASSKYCFASGIVVSAFGFTVQTILMSSSFFVRKRSGTPCESAISISTACVGSPKVSTIVPVRLVVTPRDESSNSTKSRSLGLSSTFMCFRAVKKVP